MNWACGPVVSESQLSKLKHRGSGIEELPGDQPTCPKLVPIKDA